MVLELDWEVPRSTAKTMHQRPGITGGNKRKSCNFCISEAKTKIMYLARANGFLAEAKKDEEVISLSL